MAIGWLLVAVYCLLATYRLTIDWILAGYWLSIGSADFWLVNYWVGRLHCGFGEIGANCTNRVLLKVLEKTEKI